MSGITKTQASTAKSEQKVLNFSFDEDFNILATEILVYDPTSQTLKRLTSNALSSYGTNNIEEASATLTYIGKEDGSGDWIIQKLDTSSGTVITYATKLNNPSYTNYNSAWTNRANLTYGSYKDAF